jgi:hypothetical protein
MNVVRGTSREISDHQVRIGDTAVGKGVFVTREYEPGEPVLELHGRLIDFAASLAKGERECDALQVGPDRYLDLEPPGVLVNHSCDPNVGIRDDMVLIALRRLRAGDEIRYDYSTTMDEDHWTLECRCGSTHCRGVVGDFKWLPRRRKLELIGQGVVLPFIIAAEIENGRLSAGAIRRARIWR